MSIARKLSRRRMLRGMIGGSAVSVGMPLLECFLNGNGTALADGAPLPVIFGSWFWGCGLNPGRWEPKTVGKIAELGPELKPLEPFKDRMNVVSGMKVFLDGRPSLAHYTGNWSILTGEAPHEYKITLPSIDTLVGDVIGAKTRFRSLEVCCTGNINGSFSRRGGNSANPADISPAALYQRIFGPEFKDPNAAAFTPDPRALARQSVLSAVKDQRAGFERNLGAAARIQLDEYFTSLRQLEQQLDLELQKPAPLAACAIPQKPEGEMPAATEIGTVTANHALFVGLLAHALACGQTRIVNVTFNDALSPLRRTGSQMTHHVHTHEQPIDPALGYQPDVMFFIERIVEGLRTMVAALDGVREGNGTLLDRTLLFATTDTGFAKIHALDNIPLLTFGGAAGRIKTGLHVAAQGDPATRMGLTIQQALGVPVSSWGADSMQTSKPISEFLA